MLRVTKNIYFGRSNPYWVIPNLRSIKILTYISQHRDGIQTHFDTAISGFQSRTVEILDEAMAQEFDLPRTFAVFDGHAQNNVASRRILNLITNTINEIQPPSNKGACPSPNLYDNQNTEETESPFLLRATKNIYFGRDNPSWSLVAEKAAPILQYISKNQQGINTTFRLAAPGFNSVTVEIPDEQAASEYGLPRSFRISDGHAANNSISLEIEKRIIDVIGASEFSSNSAPTTAQEKCPALLEYLTWDNRLWDTNEYSFVHDSTHGSVVNLATYSPSDWNSTYALGNNCYSYACNQSIKNYSQTNWPQPGICGGKEAPTNDDDLKRGLTMDRIIRLEPGMKPVIGSNTFPAWIVALASGHSDRGSGSEWDYHFFRKVTNGYGEHFWAHKPGASRVIHLGTGTDQLITDPEGEASKYGYDNFLGYFVIQNASVCTAR